MYRCVFPCVFLLLATLSRCAVPYDPARFPAISYDLHPYRATLLARMHNSTASDRTTPKAAKDQAQPRSSNASSTRYLPHATRSQGKNQPARRAPTETLDVDTRPTPQPTGDPSPSTTVHINSEQDFSLLLPDTPGGTSCVRHRADRADIRYPAATELISDAEADGVSFCAPGSTDPHCAKTFPDGFVRAAAISRSDDGAWIQVCRVHSPSALSPALRLAHNERTNSARSVIYAPHCQFISDAARRSPDASTRASSRSTRRTLAASSTSAFPTARSARSVGTRPVSSSCTCPCHLSLAYCHLSNIATCGPPWSTPRTDIGPDRAHLDGRSGPAFFCFARFTYNALSPAAPRAASSRLSTAFACAAASPPTIRSIAIRTAIGKGASTRFPACTTSLSSVSPAHDPALCASRLVSSRLVSWLAGWLAGWAHLRLSGCFLIFLGLITIILLSALSQVPSIMYLARVARPHVVCMSSRCVIRARVCGARPFFLYLSACRLYV